MDATQLTLLWEKVMLSLKNEVTEISYNTWIVPMEPSKLDGTDLEILVPNEFHKSYAEMYIPLISNTIKASIGVELDVSLLTKDDFVSREKDNASQGSPIFAHDDNNDDDVKYYTGRINPHYSFDSFVVGDGNRFAHAASVAVADKQGGTNFNPLFLYGGSGLGKTHLMHAIGNSIIRNNPNKVVIYVQSEQFVNEFIMTIKENKYDSFRGKYRNADILLIDDIQFIEGKNEMQKEFFHTFNALYESGKHIVMSCDKPPQSLTSLEERLRTRFSSGLTVDIQPPDYETRIAILKKRAQDSKADIPNDVLDYLASNIATNIRELEGALKTVMYYSLLSGKLDLDSAVNALKDIVSPAKARLITCDSIIEVVSNFYSITVADIKSKKRSNEIAAPRHIAMYLCRNLLDMTFPQIGGEFGNRDHSTVMHACSKITDEIKNVAQTSLDVEEIKKRING